MSLLHDKDQQ